MRERVLSKLPAVLLPSVDSVAQALQLGARVGHVREDNVHVWLGEVQRDHAALEVVFGRVGRDAQSPVARRQRVRVPAKREERWRPLNE